MTKKYALNEHTHIGLAFLVIMSFAIAIAITITMFFWNHQQQVEIDNLRNQIDRVSPASIEELEKAIRQKELELYDMNLELEDLKEAKENDILSHPKGGSI